MMESGPEREVFKRQKKRLRLFRQGLQSVHYGNGEYPRFNRPIPIATA
jgi:hypothetical protein